MKTESTPTVAEKINETSGELYNKTLYSFLFASSNHRISSLELSTPTK